VSQANRVSQYEPAPLRALTSRSADRIPGPPDIAEGPLKEKAKISKPMNGPPMIHMGMKASVI
jgi:hypothetical protein